jgi:hypothetical protein
MKDRLEHIWDHITDPYWRLDHPEVTVLLASVISGLIGLLFAWIQHRLTAAADDA